MYLDIRYKKSSLNYYPRFFHIASSFAFETSFSFFFHSLPFSENVILFMVFNMCFSFHCMENPRKMDLNYSILLNKFSFSHTMEIYAFSSPDFFFVFGEYNDSEEMILLKSRVA